MLMAVCNYQKVSLTEDENGQFSIQEASLSSKSQRSFQHGPSWMGCFLLCAATGIISLLVGSVIGPWFGQDLKRLCFEMHSTYSPAIAEIDTSYHDVRFNGSIILDSPFRGELREELNEAWQELEGFRVTMITEEEYAAIPYDIETTKVPEEAGGGYMGSLEVIHHLHCLNFMRKSSIWNHEYYKNRSAEFTDSDRTTHHHFDHCADMLRQKLMCDADVTIIPYRWVKGHADPYPNFNTLHSCRNFDSIREWSVRRQIPDLPSRYALHPLPGEKIWDSPP
ncbi:hypothetical protein M501DRAFT_975262 [Patellaria atrata CBS 101060]|uniref:Tat pathway signal sequence n=1 Tax=Patellaria atrata CBS 101060 TaxID=1346257 RepID=A0A9P4S9R2_9PEZI|nr:hypothetical protein M501DRAFT_975262 [Patellaria atrata CBS 101060]